MFDWRGTGGARYIGRERRTALREAAEEGHFDIVKYLISVGARE